MSLTLETFLLATGSLRKQWIDTSPPVEARFLLAGQWWAVCNHAMYNVDAPMPTVPTEWDPVVDEHEDHLIPQAECLGYHNVRRLRDVEAIYVAKDRATVPSTGTFDIKFKQIFAEADRVLSVSDSPREAAYVWGKPFFFSDVEFLAVIMPLNPNALSPGVTYCNARGEDVIL
jgi:hypothetical protein